AVPFPRWPRNPLQARTTGSTTRCVPGATAAALSAATSATPSSAGVETAARPGGCPPSRADKVIDVDWRPRARCDASGGRPDYHLDHRHDRHSYEVTVTKADGSQVEVHLDSAFNVMQGGGPGGLGHPNNNDADDQPGATT